MKPNTQQQFEIWEKAYFAALTGFAARDGVSESEIAGKASSTADRALQAYLEKALNFTKVSLS